MNVGRGELAAFGGADVAGSGSGSVQCGGACRMDPDPDVKCENVSRGREGPAAAGGAAAVGRGPGPVRCGGACCTDQEPCGPGRSESLARGASGCTFVTWEKSLKGAQRSYKQKAATKAQKDLFPALQEEIAERRR